MEAPYYAVIFTSIKRPGAAGYAAMAGKMMALAKKQPGFLGVESARGELGITVSYWEDETAIAQWKAQTDHLLAQELGISSWYGQYSVRVCLVEREYHFQHTP